MVIFIYLKAFQKKGIFPQKLYNVNYEIFEALFKILDDVCEINKVFFKILNFSAILYHIID